MDRVNGGQGPNSLLFLVFPYFPDYGCLGGDIEAYEVKAAAENGNVISSLYKH